MDSIGLLLVVVAVMRHAIVQIRTDRTIDRPFVERTLAGAGVFLLCIGGGALALVGHLGAGSATAPAASSATGALVVLFLLGWIAWGIVLLIRMVPRRLVHYQGLLEYPSNACHHLVAGREGAGEFPLVAAQVNGIVSWLQRTQPSRTG